MVAGEIRDPERTLPRALAVGIGIVIAVYLGANIVYLKTLGRDGLAASTAVAADTASRLIGQAGATAITVAAMLSIFGFVNVALLTNARVLYALGQDGAFLPSAGKVHPRFGSPHVALVMLGGWSLVLLFATGGHHRNAAQRRRVRGLDLLRPRRRERVRAAPHAPGPASSVSCARLSVAAGVLRPLRRGRDRQRVCVCPEDVSRGDRDAARLESSSTRGGRRPSPRTAAPGRSTST